MYKTFTAFCLGAVELVEVTDQLPGLKYTRGKSSWKVYSRHNETFEKFEDVPEKLQTQIRPSMFPPVSEAAEKSHLERWYVQTMYKVVLFNETLHGCSSHQEGSRGKIITLGQKSRSRLTFVSKSLPLHNFAANGLI